MFLNSCLISDSTKKERQKKTITEEEQGEKVWGVNDGLIKRQVEESGEHGGASEKMWGERRRQRGAGRDQYSRVMICSL